MSNARNYERLIAPDGRRVDVVKTLVAERLLDGYIRDPRPDDRPDLSASLPGKHQGRVALIAATGPSLSSVPLHTLEALVARENAVVWGVNDVWRSHREGALGCDYYVVLDERYLTTHAEPVLAYLGKFPKCLPCFAFTPDLDLRYYELRIDMHKTPETDPEYVRSHYWHGLSSGVAAVQMAMHAGCSTIYLIGHDCRAAGPKTHAFGRRSVDEAKGNYPQGSRMLDAYAVLSRHAKALGIDVFNLSAISAIDSFPRLDPVALAEGRRVPLS